MNKKFLLAALTLGTASLASIFSSAPAKAVTADVPIEVNIEPVVFLETYDKLTFEPTLEDLTGLASTTGVIRATGTTVTLDGTTSDPLGNTGTGAPTFNATKDNVSVLVYKTWGLGDTGGIIRRTVTYNDVNLTKGTSTIVVTVPDVDETVPAPGLDYGQADDGEVVFNFDFTDVKEVGLHTGGILTITATAE